MMQNLNETHDPNLKSWVESANCADTDFPIQNLPFGVFRRKGSEESFRGGVAIGDQVLDLALAHHANAFSDGAAEAVATCAQSTLNDLMSLGPKAWSALRLTLSQTLRKGAPKLLKPCLLSQNEVEHTIPAKIGDYTDFYTSLHHATNVGRLFRPDHPLLPNYQWVPIGYHGRSSSIIISEQNFHRPMGQIKPPDAPEPHLGPCQRLDYELEIGIYIGQSNELGKPVSLEHAEDFIFGLCLLNDWSARDIQAWEYQPLGPFLAKNFASSISPWIVTLEALSPYRQAWTRPQNDPQPLPYLESAKNRTQGAFDIQLEVCLETEQMRQQNHSPAPLSLSNFHHAYWTIAQLVAHHTITGCNLQPGDFFGSGTMSGPKPESGGALIELTQGGKQPIPLETGETRSFLEDGDKVIMRAWCEKHGTPRIGFGEVRGKVLPALQ